MARTLARGRSSQRCQPRSSARAPRRVCHTLPLSCGAPSPPLKPSPLPLLPSPPLLLPLPPSLEPLPLLDLFGSSGKDRCLRGTVQSTRCSLQSHTAYCTSVGSTKLVSPRGATVSYRWIIRPQPPPSDRGVSVGSTCCSLFVPRPKCWGQGVHVNGSSCSPAEDRATHTC